MISLLLPKSTWMQLEHSTSHLFCLQHIYMAAGVSKARKLYGIKYPTLYAEESHKNAKEYNCVQRAHQNSLENLPTFYALLLTAGIRYPLASAVAALVYNVGRIMYFRGYSTGDPKARTKGAFLHFGVLALLAMVGRFAFDLCTSAI